MNTDDKMKYFELIEKEVDEAVKQFLVGQDLLIDSRIIKWGDTNVFESKSGEVKFPVEMSQDIYMFEVFKTTQNNKERAVQHIRDMIAQLLNNNGVKIDLAKCIQYNIRPIKIVYGNTLVVDNNGVYICKLNMGIGLAIEY